MSLLYKFRPLANCDNFLRAEKIVTSREFWFSPLWDQNDSMEAIYNPQQIPPDQERNITPEKLRTRICSSSSEKGLYHPLMWAHYACGFKGIAIEVEVKTTKSVKVHEVVYRNNPTLITAGATDKETAHSIITSKSRIWEHESELRVTIETEPGGKKGIPKNVGKINSVILGAPYKMISNVKDIYSNTTALELYQTLFNSLRKVADENGIKTKLASLIITPTGPAVEIRNLEGDFELDR